jgi:chitinase
LSHFCQETSLDIINLGFINIFPKAVGDWPGSNFGNQCDGTVYEGTELLSGCHQIWEDIPICKELGKTVMLSLGGETAYEDIPTDEVAEWFADFLWYSFGPPGQNDTFPRPFQDNQVDGFDFDIEHDGGYGNVLPP